MEQPYFVSVTNFLDVLSFIHFLKYFNISLWGGEENKSSKEY